MNKNIKAVKDPKDAYVPQSYVEELKEKIRKGIVAGKKKAKSAGSGNN